jgi:hypothetical protein
MNSRLQSFKKVFCKQYYSLPQESDLSNNFHVNRLHMAHIVVMEAATLIPKLLRQLHKVQLMVAILLPILPRFPFNYVLNSCYIVACSFSSLFSYSFRLVIRLLFQSVILVLVITCFIIWAWKGLRSCLSLSHQNSNKLNSGLLHNPIRRHFITIAFDLASCYLATQL